MTEAREGRLWAVGDVHGFSLALARLLDRIAPQPGDTVVMLGDYIDRGPDTPGVVECLLELQRMCNVVTLRGNHEAMLLALLEQETRPAPRPSLWNRVRGRASAEGVRFEEWLQWGGRQTLAAYGVRSRSVLDLPPEHLEFFRKTVLYHETAEHIFVHGGYVPGLPMCAQDEAALLHYKLRLGVPAPHCSGKRVVVGHSAQRSGDVLDLGHILCLDTFLYGGGWLTGMELGAGQTLQVDAGGRFR